MQHRLILIVLLQSPLRTVHNVILWEPSLQLTCRGFLVTLTVTTGRLPSLVLSNEWQ